MIFKIIYEDGEMQYCVAKNMFHLLKSYDANYDLKLQEIDDIKEISDDEAFEIMIENEEYDELNPGLEPKEYRLSEMLSSCDFAIVASYPF